MATETDAEKVVRLSGEAVRRAVADPVVEDDQPRSGRRFTITKFGRHEDGYLHARITPADGKPVYVFRRYGSWQAPGALNGKAVLKDVLYEAAVALQEKARPFDKADRRAREAADPDTKETQDASTDGPGAEDDEAAEGGASTE